MRHPEMKCTVCGADLTEARNVHFVQTGDPLCCVCWKEYVKKVRQREGVEEVDSTKWIAWLLIAVVVVVFIGQCAQGGI